jgi:predicted MPP superfamily phosphohydrolase
MLSLPLSALTHWIDNLLLRFRARKPALAADEPVEERRRILKTAAAGFPILALSAGGAGVSAAFALPEFPEIRMRFPSLPAGLRGFRIAQISDLHLGFILGLDHLEKIARLTADQRPDLVLLTGDYCDDATIYLQALNIASRIPARCGVYASIGNHEYFRGIDIILKAYERSTVPLLRDTGTLIETGASPLYLAGADDPRTLGKTSGEFFKNTIDASTRNAPAGAFTVLMSHRPEGFNYAASIGIPLTLAGHTHGGQIGLMGRSVFESVMPERYMWGLYERGSSRLYTTSGAGHWFPYRLGCRAEVPVFVLER